MSFCWADGQVTLRLRDQWPQPGREDLGSERSLTFQDAQRATLEARRLRS
jgi:hypothetical protein